MNSNIRRPMPLSSLIARMTITAGKSASKRVEAEIAIATGLF
jgi:hypothetical protein